MMKEKPLYKSEINVFRILNRVPLFYIPFFLCITGILTQIFNFIFSKQSFSDEYLICFSVALILIIFVLYTVVLGFPIVRLSNDFIKLNLMKIKFNEIESILIDGKQKPWWSLIKREAIIIKPKYNISSSQYIIWVELLGNGHLLRQRLIEIKKQIGNANHDMKFELEWNKKSIAKPQIKYTNDTNVDRTFRSGILPFDFPVFLLLTIIINIGFIAFISITVGWVEAINSTMFFSCPLIILFWPLMRSSEKYYFIVNENYLIIKNISYFWYRKTVPISDVALCYISWVSEAATQFNEFRIIQNDYQSFSFKTAVSVEELRCLYHEIQMRKDAEMPAIGKY